MSEERWGVSIYSDHEDDTSDSSEHGGEESDRESVGEVVHMRESGATSSGVPKETVHLLRQTTRYSPYPPDARKRRVPQPAPPGAFVRRGQFLVDPEVLSKFTEGDTQAVNTLRPPFVSEINQADTQELMRWKTATLKRQMEMKKDPYYRFAATVSQKSGIKLDLLWTTPDFLPPALKRPAFAPAPWSRETAYLPEGGGLEVEKVFEDDGDLTPLVGTPPTSPGPPLPTTTRKERTPATELRTAPAAAGASVKDLTTSLLQLHQANVPLDSRTTDTVLGRLLEEATDLPKIERDRRAALSENSQWIQEPLVTGVAAFSEDRLLPAAESALEHLFTEIFPGREDDKLLRRRYTLDYFIKNNRYRAKFAHLSATFLLETRFQAPTQWERRELPLRNDFERARLVNWFRRNLASGVPRTPDSGFRLAMRTVLDTNPENVVGWVGSGLTPLPHGVAQSSRIFNFRAHSGL